MSKRPASHTGDSATIPGHPESVLGSSGSERDLASERAQARILINEFVQSISMPESQPDRPLVLPADPPYETIHLLCRILMNGIGRPNPSVSGTLQQINNLFPNSVFHDMVNNILYLYEKSQPNLELDRILNEVLDNAQPDSPGEKRPKFLTDAVVAAPKGAGYVELARELEGLNHDFRREIAARLEPALIAHIRAMPHDDLEGKKKVAEFVTAELERFGLAVKCPNTGLPGKLKASTGHWPGVGRFHFEVYVDGQRKIPAYSDTLPELQLIDETPAQGPQAEWQGKVGPKSARRGRKLT